MNRILIPVIMTISLSGCIVVPPNPNSLKLLMIDECADARRSGTGFNSRKSYQLVRYECAQNLGLNEEFQKIDDIKFRKNPRMTDFDEQEDFDAETWFLITEVVRKKYYPDYLEPEQEVIRANALAEQQRKTIEDKSVWRDWEPRLLPVSPYLMSHKQLRMADEAISDLIAQKKGDKFFTKLMVINRIMAKERLKKNPYARNY